MMEQSRIDTAEAMVRAYADKNWSEIWSLAAPHIVYDEAATGRKAFGIKGFMTYLQEWGAAFPDSEITVLHMDASESGVTFDLHWKGTHEGPIETAGGTILPTGKKIDIPARMLVEVGEEKVESVTHNFDVGTLEKQLEHSADENVA